MLIKYGAKVNVKDVNEQTPLHLAAIEGICVFFLNQKKTFY